MSCCSLSLSLSLSLFLNGSGHCDAGYIAAHLLPSILIRPRGEAVSPQGRAEFAAGYAEITAGGCLAAPRRSASFHLQL